MNTDRSLIPALYCRTALKNEHDITTQRNCLKGYARSLGYDSFVIYEDDGASGLTLGRPGFRQMERDIQAGRIGAVIVADISRIGRDMCLTAHWVDCIIRNGIEFISVKPDKTKIGATL